MFLLIVVPRQTPHVGDVRAAVVVVLEVQPVQLHVCAVVLHAKLDAQTEREKADTRKLAHSPCRISLLWRTTAKLCAFLPSTGAAQDYVKPVYVVGDSKRRN